MELKEVCSGNRRTTSAAPQRMDTVGKGYPNRAWKVCQAFRVPSDTLTAGAIETCIQEVPVIKSSTKRMAAPICAARCSPQH